MTKHTQQKIKKKNNFYDKLKTMKDEYRMKQNMFCDSMCRLIKQVTRELSRNDTQEGLFEAKIKTVELSMVATQEIFKKIATRCSKASEAERLIAEISKISERKTKKKSDIIALVNYIRRLMKGIQISNQMNNLSFNKDQ